MTPVLTLQHAETDADVAACFGIMQQLRPHLRTPEELVARIALQRPQGYRLLAIWDGRQPVALAGYRQLDNTIYGRFLYVDDLVTDADERGHGHGERLIEALREIGRGAACTRLVLDTALPNVFAQRFYFRVGLLPHGLHFSGALS
jgi:ribosomal protein S18 acetylase RimI-like enzyme